MSEIIRSQHDGLRAIQAKRGPAQRVPRSLVKQIDHEAHAALVRAARVQGVAYVTHVALREIALLSAEESHLIEFVPASDPIQKDKVARRLSMLVDNCTIVMATEIAQAGM